MREIKFRFYSNLTKKMHNELSLLGLQYQYNKDPEVYGADTVYCATYGTERVQRYSDGVLMQFTGLQVNGQDIYEGDILEIDKWVYGHKPITVAVEWDNENASFTAGDYYLAEILNLAKAWGAKVTVIGNVWENPDLLKEAKE